MNSTPFPRAKTDFMECMKCEELKPRENWDFIPASPAARRSRSSSSSTGLTKNVHRQVAKDAKKSKKQGFKVFLNS